MSDEAADSMLSELRSLPVLAPDPGRTGRVRARCHAAIARRHQQAARSARRARFIARALEPVLIGGLGAIYLAAVIHGVLRLRGVL